MASSRCDTNGIEAIDRVLRRLSYATLGMILRGATYEETNNHQDQDTPATEPQAYRETAQAEHTPRTLKERG